MINKILKITSLVSGLLLAAPALASGGGEMPASGANIFDTASLQRGAKLYFNYCSGCHSLKFMRYSRIGEDLKLSENEVMENFNFTGAKYGEVVLSSLRPEDGEKWFGKAPPDLSLTARSRGTDWIYNYLKSFYIDHSRPVGWNNTVFPNASMPNVLWELQGTQQLETHSTKASQTDHGTKHETLVVSTPGKLNAEEFDEVARDLTAFLQYVGEPAALKRQHMGVWVLLYLAVFTGIAWLLKKEYWKDVH